MRHLSIHVAFVALSAVILNRLREVAGVARVITSLVTRTGTAALWTRLPFIELIFQIRDVLEAAIAGLGVLGRFVVFLRKLILLILVSLIFLWHLGYTHHHDGCGCTSREAGCMTQAAKVR